MKKLLLLIMLAATPALADSTASEAFWTAAYANTIEKIQPAGAERQKIWDVVPITVDVEFTTPPKAQLLAMGTTRQEQIDSISWYYSWRTDQLLLGFADPDIQWISTGVTTPIMRLRLATRDALVRVLRSPDVRQVTRSDLDMPVQLVESWPMMRVDTVQAASYKGAGSVVALIDTGVSSGSEPYTSGKVSLAIDMTNDGFGPWDQTGHGTTMAALISRTAPDARIISCRAGGTRNPATKAINDNLKASSIQKCIDWIIRNQEAYRIGVVNMSFSMPNTSTAVTCATTMSRMIADLVNFDIVPVLAAGNSATKSELPEPACSNHGLTVGAVWDYAANTGSPSPDSGSGSSCVEPSHPSGATTCWSNSAAELDILAPGCVIVVPGFTRPWTNSMTHCGTSASAALVSGALAAARGAAPKLTAGVMRDLVRQQSTRKVLDRWNSRSTPVLDVNDLITRAKLYQQSVPAPATVVYKAYKGPKITTSGIKDTTDWTDAQKNAYYGLSNTGPCDCGPQ